MSSSSSSTNSSTGTDPHMTQSSSSSSTSATLTTTSITSGQLQSPSRHSDRSSTRASTLSSLLPPGVSFKKEFAVLCKSINNAYAQGAGAGKDEFTWPAHFEGVRAAVTILSGARLMTPTILQALSEAQLRKLTQTMQLYDLKLMGARAASARRQFLQALLYGSQAERNRCISLATTKDSTFVCKDNDDSEDEDNYYEDINDEEDQANTSNHSTSHLLANGSLSVNTNQAADRSNISQLLQQLPPVPSNPPLTTQSSSAPNDLLFRLQQSSGFVSPIMAQPRNTQSVRDPPRPVSDTLASDVSIPVPIISSSGLPRHDLQQQQLSQLQQQYNDAAIYIKQLQQQLASHQQPVYSQLSRVQVPNPPPPPSPFPPVSSSLFNAVSMLPPPSTSSISPSLSDMRIAEHAFYKASGNFGQHMRDQTFQNIRNRYECISIGKGLDRLYMEGVPLSSQGVEYLVRRMVGVFVGDQTGNWNMCSELLEDDGCMSLLPEAVMRKMVSMAQMRDSVTRNVGGVYASYARGGGSSTSPHVSFAGSGVNDVDYNSGFPVQGGYRGGRGGYARGGKSGGNNPNVLGAGSPVVSDAVAPGASKK